MYRPRDTPPDPVSTLGGALGVLPGAIFTYPLPVKVPALHTFGNKSRAHTWYSPLERVHLHGRVLGQATPPQSGRIERRDFPIGGHPPSPAVAFGALKLPLLCPATSTACPPTPTMVVQGLANFLPEQVSAGAQL